MWRPLETEAGGCRERGGGGGGGGGPGERTYGTCKSRGETEVGGGVGGRGLERGWVDQTRKKRRQEEGGWVGGGGWGWRGGASRN